MPLMKHAAARYTVAAAFALACTGVYAQAQDGKGIEVKKQTAASSPQTVVETPRSRDEEKEHHVLDATNTKRYPTDHSLPRDGYGVPVPQPPPGQGTNSSTDAMRAADKKH